MQVYKALIVLRSWINWKSSPLKGTCCHLRLTIAARRDSLCSQRLWLFAPLSLLAYLVKLHTHTRKHTHTETHTHQGINCSGFATLLFVLENLGLVKTGIETSGPLLWLFLCQLCFSESSLTDSSESVCKSDSWGNRQNPSKGLLHSFSHKRWDLLIRLTLLTYFRTEPHLHPGTASPWWFEQALLTVSSNRLSGFNIWLSFPQVHDQVFSLRYELTEHCAQVLCVWR